MALQKTSIQVDSQILKDPLDDETQAVRVEFNYRVPCWHCSKMLCNKDGKPNPPLVGYRIHIHGAPRVLHRTCVESLGVRSK